MRHAYVADVGDYGKYGLLRAITRDCNLWRLGVIWYLTDTIEQNNDGKHAAYLADAEVNGTYRCCDPDLFDVLRSIRQQSVLDLSLIENRNVLPTSTIFFRVPVPTKGHLLTLGTDDSLSKLRTNWYSEAAAAVSQSNIVFLDPDNGVLFLDDMPVTSKNQHLKNPSHKHSYWNEISALLDAGKSVIAYHHLGRQLGGHLQQIQRLNRTISSLGYGVKALHYRRGSARVFFVISATRTHHKILSDSATSFASKWSKHCQLVR